MINASLTSNGIVLDNVRTKQKARSGCFPAGQPTKLTVEFEKVLGIERLAENQYKLCYCRDMGSPDKQQYYPTVDTVVFKALERDVTEEVMCKAYPEGCTRWKRLLVLINPHGGPGRAKQIFSKHCEPMLKAAGCSTKVITTTHRYHAQEIANDMDLEEFDGVVCCSGDGIPHEVLNGFANRKHDAIYAMKTMPICQLPCGSGNSMAMSLNGNPSPTRATLCIIKGMKMPVDLMSISQKSHTKVSFLSQTYGQVADADLGTEHMRWMGGARFTVGLLQSSFSQKTYPCDLYVKFARENKDGVREHFKHHIAQSPEPSSPPSLKEGTETCITDLIKYGSVEDKVPEGWTEINRPNLSLFYVGKMPWMSADALVFPASLPTDGTLDMVSWDASIGRMRALSMLTKIESGEHFNSKHVQYSKVEAYRLVPKTHGYLSIDGESFPCEPFQVEVLPSAGCLLSSTRSYVKTHLHTTK